jgi:hypothetical protein
VPETSNPHLFLYCLWRLQAGSGYVALEELVEECWRVAPSRFGWSTRAYPSDKAGDQALRDVLKDQELRDLVLVSGKRSVRLSAEGVAWVRERLSQFEGLAGQRAPSKRPSQRHLMELEQSSIGHSLLRGDELASSRAQVADLLRLTPDADGHAFRERLASYRSDAELGGRQDALIILDRLAAARPGWFNGEAQS